VFILLIQKRILKTACNRKHPKQH